MGYKTIGNDTGMGYFMHMVVSYMYDWKELGNGISGSDNVYCGCGCVGCGCGWSGQ